jgi:hypothetical protein
MLAPLHAIWTGAAFEPTRRYLKDCAALSAGELYKIEVFEERSEISHRHEFAWLRTAWRNLPENIADRFASPEHLRKRALIDAGFYNEMAIDAGTNAAAIRVAAGFRSHDEFIAAVVRGPIVLIRTAKSQSYRAMGADDFQKSKTAILGIISALIGVKPEELEREAGKE